jgi:acetylornithine deacetylase
LAQIGIPSLVFGPGGIEQAHTKDEWVEIAHLEKAVSILFDCVAGVGHG